MHFKYYDGATRSATDLFLSLLPSCMKNSLPSPPPSLACTSTYPLAFASVQFCCDLLPSFFPSSLFSTSCCFLSLVSSMIIPLFHSVNLSHLDFVHLQRVHPHLEDVHERDRDLSKKRITTLTTTPQNPLYPTLR